MSSSSRYPPNRQYTNRNYSSRGQAGAYSSAQQPPVNQNRGFKRKYNAYDSYNNGPSSYKARQNLYQHHSASRAYENQYQMWMGDLDPSWTEKSIHSMWSALVAPPKSVKIMRDRLNPSKPSYSFVTFEDQEALDWALQRNGQVVPNTHRKFKLSHANSNNNNISGAGAAGSGRQSTGEYSLFVGDLAQDVSEAALYSKFNLKYPNQIKSARVIVDQDSKLGKGFGFVKFFTGDTMERALKEMQGVMLGSKAIRVGIAAGSEVAPSSSQSKPDLKKYSIPQSQPELNASTDENNTNITISGLSSKFTETDLELMFLAFGDLVYCRLSRDLQSGYIKFVTRNAAELAMSHVSGGIVDNCRLELTWGSSTKVEDGPTNFEPKSDGSYEKGDKTPLLYMSSEYQHKRLYSLTKDEINAYTARLDGSESMSTRQANEIYLQKKMARECL